MEKLPLELKDLTIRRSHSWEDNPNSFVAHVEYEGTSGTFKFPMSEEIVRPLMEFLGPLLAKFGSQAASDLAASVTRAIENKETISLPEPVTPDEQAS